MNDATRLSLISDFKSNLARVIGKYNIDDSRIYNADQTGLFYQKLPNFFYADQEARRTMRGTKQMKAKERVTLMVGCAASGAKIPLFMVGKSKTPTCFKLARDGNPPMDYTHQTNAWFDKAVMITWINNVFWPYHERTHGEKVHALLILDNFSGQKDFNEELLPEHLHIVYLPPNTTSTNQPCDQGIIACLKVGYRSIMLRKLLSIFDADGGFDRAAEQRVSVPRGCKGLAYGGKATILDAMEILLSLWNEDGKYASQDSIQRSWRKADILSATWNADLNNKIGSLSLSAAKKSLPADLCAELCGLMNELSFMARKTNVTGKLAPAFDASFVTEDTKTPEELETMASNWIDVEDDHLMKDALFDDEIQNFLQFCEEGNSNEVNPDYDDEEDEDNEVMGDASNEPHLSFVEVEHMLVQVRRYTEKENLDGMEDLDRYMRKLRISHLNKPKAQKTITSFFSLSKK